MGGARRAGSFEMYTTHYCVGSSSYTTSASPLLATTRIKSVQQYGQIFVGSTATAAPTRRRCRGTMVRSIQSKLIHLPHRRAEQYLLAATLGAMRSIPPDRRYVRTGRQPQLTGGGLGPATATFVGCGGTSTSSLAAWTAVGIGTESGQLDGLLRGGVKVVRLPVPG